VVVGPDFETVDDVIEAEGPFDVLIAGPVASSSPQGLEQLRRLGLRLPHTNIVLAVERFRGGVLRETVRTGAVDVLRLPVTDDVMAESVEQALENVLPRRPVTSVAPPAPPPTAGNTEGTVITVVSATGGCGKTFLSTNLAYHLQSHGKRTCVIDVDLQFGELSTALRLKPRYTIADLVANQDPDHDELTTRLEQSIVCHETGIAVLAAPMEPVEADTVGPADVANVIRAAKSRFDYVIVDTPAALSEAVLVAVEQADQIFAVATLDLPSVRNLGVMLATLKQLKVPQDSVQLVLNKVEPDVGMDVGRVTRYFPQGFSMVVPYAREVNRSLNMGMPMLAFAPRNEVSKALAIGLAATLHVEGHDIHEGAASHRCLPGPQSWSSPCSRTARSGTRRSTRSSG
jgi:pilus assembly protein CpaE